MKHRRPVLRPRNDRGALLAVEFASQARHQHAMHEPSCPACDPAEYAAQDARHRNDVIA